jgi:glucose-6-phosphate isomerase
MAAENGQGRSLPEAWDALRLHAGRVAALHMRDLFAADPARAERLSLTLDDLLVDFSRHRVTDETLSLLLDLARAAALPAAMEDLFAGRPVNRSEGRPALHTALRAPAGQGPVLDGLDVTRAVHDELERMLAFVTDLGAGAVTGASGRPLDTVVNIGIGGSDLGPRLGAEALYECAVPGLRFAFAANIDDRDLHHTLESCDPHRTLFVTVSKTFSTAETLANAKAARQWLERNGCTDWARHFAAVTANAAAAERQGYAPDRIFRFWEWVGGRYSVWSTVGLSLAARIGAANFRRFLAGAHAMDRHFREAPLHRNIPAVLGLLDVWYASFLGAETLAVVPYDQRLRLLPEYLGQLVMESNGKGTLQDGSPVRGPTSPILWGAVGSNAQHAFFQLLHQGTHLVPVDLLVGVRAGYDEAQHAQLFTNCVAQGAALMAGRDNPGEPHRHFPGNRPSTTIVYDDLTPETLGMLIALYEHRTFVAATVWGINPFDQWGVELGKEMARELENGTPATDPSTRRLLDWYTSRRSRTQN